MITDHDLWVPHRRETWPWRTGKLLRDVELCIRNGHSAKPEFTTRTASKGTLVKIVMVSRFGDVGITDNLSADHGYHARVLLTDLEEFEEPSPNYNERADQCPTSPPAY